MEMSYQEFTKKTMPITDLYVKIMPVKLNNVDCVKQFPTTWLLLVKSIKNIWNQKGVDIVMKKQIFPKNKIQKN